MTQNNPLPCLTLWTRHWPGAAFSSSLQPMEWLIKDFKGHKAFGVGLQLQVYFLERRAVVKHEREIAIQLVPALRSKPLMQWVSLPCHMLVKLFSLAWARALSNSHTGLKVRKHRTYQPCKHPSWRAPELFLVVFTFRSAGYMHRIDSVGEAFWGISSWQQILQTRYCVDSSVSKTTLWSVRSSVYCNSVCAFPRKKK